LAVLTTQKLTSEDADSRWREPKIIEGGGVQQANWILSSLVWFLICSCKATFTIKLWFWQA